MYHISKCFPSPHGVTEVLDSSFEVFFDDSFLSTYEVWTYSIASSDFEMWSSLGCFNNASVCMEAKFTSSQWHLITVAI